VKYNNIELNVLVKGKPITEYRHNSQIFVEGRDGSDFELQVRNLNNFRVEAIVSVDGLSVLDGKDAGPASSGYVLEANETIAIPGWKLNDAQVASFRFAGKKGSYANQSTGSARNTGVIGIMVYAENRVHHSAISAAHYGQMTARATPNWGQAPNMGIPGLPGAIYNGLPPYGTCVNTFAPTTNLSWDTSIGGSSYGLTGAMGVANTADSVCTASLANLDAQSMLTSGSLDDDSWETTTYSSRGPSVRGMMSADSATLSASAIRDSRHRSVNKRSIAKAVAAPVVQQTLGTAFGSAQDFATQTVSFVRGDLLSVQVIYYDDKRGLQARGVVMERPKTRRKRPEAPQAFPAQMGCTPPRGWQG
jgi:hypothetical protein